MYKGWVIFKQASLGTEEEVMNLVLDSKIPKNIAKSKRKRKTQLSCQMAHLGTIPRALNSWKCSEEKQEKEEKESSRMLVSSLFKQIFFLSM